MRKSPEPATPLRVAFYTRISTDEDHQKFSLQAQRDRLTAYCNATYDNWELFKLYADQSTGSNMVRSGLAEMLRDVRQKQFDVLLVFKVDRLSRNVRQLAEMVEDVIKIGIILKSVTEPFDTSTGAGRMMLQMLGVFAEFEHSNIKERTKVGMRKKAEKGEWCGGMVPYGYKVIPGNGLKVNPDEAQIVRRVFDQYTNDRVGSMTIARSLNATGIRKQGGSKWRTNDILKILKRHVYTGLIHWGGVEQKGLHEAIIGTAQFQEAQKIMDQRVEDKSLRNSNRSDFLLSGNIYCGVCGKRMVGCSGHKKEKKFNYYACTTRLNHGKKECALDYARADLLEQAVLEQVKKVAADPEVCQAIIKAANKKLKAERPEITTALKMVESKLEKTKNSLERYFQAFEDGSMDPASCGGRIKALNEQVTVLQEERARLQNQVDRMTVEMGEGQLVGKFLELFDVIMKKGAPASKRKHLISGLVPRIVVYSKDEIEIYFRAPLSLVRVVPSMAPLHEPY